MPKAEYGRVLFERDQAQRTLQMANVQRRSVRKQWRNNVSNGMKFFPFSINVTTSGLFNTTTTNIKLTPAQYLLHKDIINSMKTKCLFYLRSSYITLCES